ncbi:MAG: GNAT family N-acetyltransferase [Pseudomonadota bacterium]
MFHRAAKDADAEAVARIVNAYIRDTTVSFAETEKTVDLVAQEIAGRQAEGRPFLVVQVDGRVVGYATYDQFRKGSGYGRTMEHTVMLEPEPLRN